MWSILHMVNDWNIWGGTMIQYFTETMYSCKKYQYQMFPLKYCSSFLKIQLGLCKYVQSVSRHAA